MNISSAFVIGGIFGSLSAPASALATYTVGAQQAAATYAVTGTVEAVRQGTLGAQVSGRVVELLVRSGDDVKTGQVLVQIDAGDATDAAAAGAAAAGGAAARLVNAQADFERAQRLRAREFISVAALQRAEVALRSAEAESQAAAAQAKAARTRAAWQTVRAPYAGRVTSLAVSAGDLATPGRPLVAMYDPAALRVVAHVPESVAPRLMAGRAALVVVPGSAPMEISGWRIVAAVDPATHSVEVRADLPKRAPVQPGQFAALRLPLGDAAVEIRVPVRVIVHRSEVTAVYVVDAGGAAHLRQIRLGAAVGDEVTVLAGLERGEQVALDPIVAGRQ